MQKAGIEPEQRVVTYCGVGISASLGLFSLYLAGYRDVALYDSSWEEWGTDPKRLRVYRRKGKDKAHNSGTNLSFRPEA